MAPYENPEARRYDDVRNILLEAKGWASNAASYAEHSDEEDRATAAIWAQVATALAIEGLAAAILATRQPGAEDGKV